MAEKRDNKTSSAKKGLLSQAKKDIMSEAHEIVDSEHRTTQRGLGYTVFTTVNDDEIVLMDSFWDEAIETERLYEDDDETCFIKSEGLWKNQHGQLMLTKQGSANKF